MSSFGAVLGALVEGGGRFVVVGGLASTLPAAGGSGAVMYDRPTLLSPLATVLGGEVDLYTDITSIAVFQTYVYAGENPTVFVAGQATPPGEAMAATFRWPEGWVVTSTAPDCAGDPFDPAAGVFPNGSCYLQWCSGIPS